MRTLSFSQNIYPHILNDSLVIITAEQLKATNFIFLEHSELKSINSELNSQLVDYRLLHEEDLRADSLYKIILHRYEDIVDANKVKIEQQQQVITKNAKKLKMWRISGCSAFILLIALCIL